MKKNRKTRWMALAIAVSCTGCASSGSANTPGLFSSWRNPFASSVAESRPPVREDEHDDILRRDKKAKPDASFFIAAGNLALDRGDHTAALTQYQQAIKLEPKSVSAHRHLAMMHERLQQYPEAEKVYEAAIAAAPTDPVPLNDLALCLSKQQRYDESIALLNKAINLRPHQTFYRNNIAGILVRAGRPREAFDHLTVVHSVAEAHYNLGVMLRQAGEIEPSRQQMLAALQVDPGFVAAKNALAGYGDYGANQPVRQAARPTAKEVSTPRNLRAQSSAPSDLEFDQEEGAPTQRAPQKQNGYYDGAEEESGSSPAPAEVLARRNQEKPARKSPSELRAKIEDSSPVLR
jgi:tetratricopeptide (TPR) repeat protein